METDEVETKSPYASMSEHLISLFKLLFKLKEIEFFVTSKFSMFITAIGHFWNSSLLFFVFTSIRFSCKDSFIATPDFVSA